MSNPDRTAASSRRARLLAAIAYVIGGLIVAALLTGARVLIDHSPWGRDYQLWAFGKLQGVLSTIDPDNPVVLLDISDLAGGRARQITPRKTLTDIIAALADQNPRAIAVDIDFSPYETGYVTNEDPDFFDFCLDVQNKRKVPLFLAVARTKLASREAWLGEEKYAPLAVAVAVNQDDTRRVPLWVMKKNSAERLNSMSYALAQEYRKRLPQPPRWMAGVVEKEMSQEPSDEDETDDEFSPVYADRLVNYSKLDLLKASAQKDTSAEAVKNSGNYHDKLVILGDVALPLDPLPIPGRLHNEAGALVEACATYTLVREPLFELTAKVRNYLDLSIAGCIVLMVAIIRYRNPENAYWMGKQAVFIYVAVLVVILSGFLLVRLFGVMWLDFVLVSGTLLLHPKIEVLIHKICHLLKRRRPSQTHSTMVTAILCVCITALSLSSETHAQGSGSLCQQRVAAVAVRITTKGNKACYVKESKDASADRLATTDAGKRRFHAGQRLSCDKNCSLVIVLCGTGAEHPVTERMPQWYAVLNVFRAPEHHDRFRGSAVRTSKNFTPLDPRSSWVSHFKGGSAPILAIANIRPHSYDPPPTTPESKVLKAKLVALLEEGKTRRIAKEYEAAERAFIEAYDIEVSKLKIVDGRAAWGLGNVYADQRMWRAAAEAYQKATFWLVDPELYLAYGFALLQPQGEPIAAERIREAERYLRTAALLEPDDPRTIDLYYEALEKLGARPDQLEEAYRWGLKLNSHSFQTNLRLSRLLKTLGRMDDARKYLKKAENSARAAGELLTVGLEWELQQDYQRAERLLAQSAALHSDPTTLMALGRMQMANKHNAEAIQSLRSAITLNPDGFEAKYLVAVAELRLAQLVEAQQDLEQAAAKKTPQLDDSLALACAFAAIGDAYMASGRTTEAIGMYERALSYDSEDQETRYKLSEAQNGKRP